MTETGSAVVVVAVPVTVIVPLGGAVKLTLQVMLAPAPSIAVGDDGEQTTVAPAGKPLTAQPALAATLGPRLVQVTVPVTTEPAGGLLGKPLMIACMSACGVMTIGLVSTLFDGFGSAVMLPAVVLMLSVPLAGAVNVLVQVIVALTAKGSGIGSGRQLCVAPGGNPLNTHVGVAAGPGPAFVQVPLTVTDCPANTLAGAVVTACISACATIPTDCCAVLLVGRGSAVALPAVPVMVTLGTPAAGAV